MLIRYRLCYLIYSYRYICFPIYLDHPVFIQFIVGFHIIIPSKLDVGDINTICKKAGLSEETCTIWPMGYSRKGLQDKHMPFIMWNLASKLRWVTRTLMLIAACLFLFSCCKISLFSICP